MNINARIRRFHQRNAQAKGNGIPPWAELQKLTEEQVRALAGRLGIEYSERMATLSEINKRRG